MEAAFPEALTAGYERLLPVMPNEPKDRHVLAVAILTGSQVIVTANLSDFPPAALQEFDVEAQSPDVFLLHQSDLDVTVAVRLLRAQANEKTRPPRTVENVLERLATSAPTFATAMGILLGVRLESARPLPPGVPNLEAEVHAALQRRSAP